MKLSGSEKKPEAEEALENLIKLSAQGARRFSAESLRQKDRADKHIKSYTFFCISMTLFFRPPSGMRAVEIFI